MDKCFLALLVEYEVELYRKDTGCFFMGFTDGHYLTCMNEILTPNRSINAIMKEWFSSTSFCDYWEGDLNVQDVDELDIYLSRYKCDSDPDNRDIIVLCDSRDRRTILQQYMSQNVSQRLSFISLTDLVKSSELDYIFRITNVSQHQVRMGVLD